MSMLSELQQNGLVLQLVFCTAHLDAFVEEVDRRSCGDFAATPQGGVRELDVIVPDAMNGIFSTSSTAVRVAQIKH